MPYIMKESSAGRGSHGQPYVRVAVLRVEPGVTEVRAISTHAKGVLEIIEVLEHQFDGVTDNCQGARARRYATLLAAELTALEAAS